MGIKNLWQLLSPVGRSVSIETLAGKVRLEMKWWWHQPESTSTVASNSALDPLAACLPCWQTDTSNVHQPFDRQCVR